MIKDKVAVVTGASDGIGREITLKLAKQGVNLALVARNEERLKEVTDESLKLGSPKAVAYTCDLRKREEIERRREEVRKNREKKFGKEKTPPISFPVHSDLPQIF